MRRRANVCRLLVAAGLAAGAGWADQVVMKNGDRISGTIEKQDGKTIAVKTAAFGSVTGRGTRWRRSNRTSRFTLR